MKKTLVLFLLNWLCLPLAMSQTQVALFKNGTSFFTKNLQLDLANGVATLPTVPEATFGTLWFATEGTPLRSVRTEKVDRPTTIGAVGLPSLLQANVGKRVTLFLTDGNPLEGTLEHAKPEWVSLRTATGWHQVPVTGIRQFQMTDQPQTTLTFQETSRALKLDFGPASTPQNVSLGYLRKGISWLPTYRVDLTDDKTASLTLHAEVLNDAEDLTDAQLSFVVGVPNFAYQYLTSPLAYEGEVLSFINQLNQTSNEYAPRNRRNDNIMAQSMSNAYSTANYDNGPVEPETSETEDLFFYKPQTLSLKKGERAMLPVLQATGAYEHVYEVELPAGLARPPYARNDDDEEANRRLVWHSILLKNEGKLPWTTGAALLTQRTGTSVRPLAQDKLGYTPPGAKAKIKITVAPNIFVKDSELELSRKEVGKLKDDHYYDHLTVEAKIELRSFKDKEVTLKVSRLVEGTPLKCDVAWKTEKLVQRQQGFSPPHQLTWEVTLKPGEVREVTYQYQVLVRR
jgi:hypothetical protein